MTRFYANENFPRQVVEALRKLGNDVLTSAEAANANRAVPDEEVLAYATSTERILLTQNRLHFIRLHQRRTGRHAGIVACTFNPDFAAQARQIHEAVRMEGSMLDRLVRVNRDPGKDVD